MNEGEMIAVIKQTADAYALHSIGASYSGVDLPYQVGLRQGTWRGLNMAIEAIQKKLKEKEDKEKEL